MTNITEELINVGCVQYGDFTLKSGAKSNIYVDLRIIPSFPSLFKTISNELTQLIISQNIQFDFICGVPFGGLSYATAIALNMNKPTLLVRKEVKTHGTKKNIEGVFQKGQHVILIEDVITSGQSILEIAEILKKEGLNVIHAFVILNREEKGEENLKEIKLSSVLKLKDLKQKEEKIEKSFIERSKLTKNAIAKKLFEIMDEKKSNLALSIDVTKKQEVLEIVEKCGNEICLLKTHVDILEDFDQIFIEKLTQLSQKYNFLILEGFRF
jgi:uridine monophosphate synthetase